MKRDKIMAGKGSGHVNSYIANTSPLLARTCLHVYLFLNPSPYPKIAKKMSKLLKWL
jgi:hypothetical protein